MANAVLLGFDEAGNLKRYRNRLGTDISDSSPVTSADLVAIRAALGYSNTIPALGYVNVLDYGAVGNGVADDTAAFVAAHNALSTLGGEIYVPPGRYRFNLTVIKNNVKIRSTSCIKDYTNPLPTSYFTPADPTKPVLQIGTDSFPVKGFRLENCTLWGGVGPYGDCGIDFNCAFECFLREISVWNFKTNFRFIAGATNPCSLIFIDHFCTQNSPDANARGFYAQSPAWSSGSYTTAIFLSNGHVQGPAGANSYAIEADGVKLDLSNVYFDLEQGKGILLKETNSSDAPMLRCANVIFDHPYPNDVLVTVQSSSFTTISSYVWGTATMKGKLQLANATTMAIIAPASLSEFSELSYPYVYGNLYFADPNGDGSRLTDCKLQRSATRLYIQNTAHNVSLLAQEELELGSGNAFNWKIDAAGRVLPATPLDIGASGAPAGTVYCQVLNTSGALVVGTQILLKNTKGIFFEDNAGVSETVLGESVGNNVFLTAPTSGGSVILGARNAAGKVQFTSPLTGDITKIPIYANNTAAAGGGLAAGDFYRTGGDPDHLCVVH